MAQNPWGTPRRPRGPAPTGDEREVLRRIGAVLRPSLRIGRKGIDSVAVAKANAHLASDQVVKAEFVGHGSTAIRAMADDLAARTKAHCISIHGSMAVLYRRDPRSNLHELAARHLV